MTEAERIAAGLTDAQRRVFATAKVHEPQPLSIMPSYWAIELADAGASVAEIHQLCELGLVTLPIRTGGRHGPSVHYGEIHPLGLEVREILTRSRPDGNQ